jgi:hypothetical protein
MKGNVVNDKSVYNERLHGRQHYWESPTDKFFINKELKKLYDDEGEFAEIRFPFDHIGGHDGHPSYLSTQLAILRKGVNCDFCAENHTDECEQCIKCPRKAMEFVFMKEDCLTHQGLYDNFDYKACSTCYDGQTLCITDPHLFFNKKTKRRTDNVNDCRIDKYEKYRGWRVITEDGKEMIDITGINRRELIRQLWFHTVHVGLGFLHRSENSPNEDEIERAIEADRADYITGKPIKIVHMSEGYVDCTLYDELAGKEGTLRYVVEQMRKGGKKYYDRVTAICEKVRRGGS